MKCIKYTKIISFFVCIILSSCKFAGKEARKYDITKIILNQCKTIFSGIEISEFNLDTFTEGIEYDVRKVIPKDMFEGYFIDGWGNPIHCMILGDKMHVWSNGVNLVNEQRQGDDIVIIFEFKALHGH